MFTKTSQLLVVIASTAIVGGCVSFEPIRLHDPDSVDGASYGVLWSRSMYASTFFERLNGSTVISVDGVAMASDKTLSGPPIELLPGRHIVEVRYERAFPIPNYFGTPLFIKQSERSIEAVLEAGHSYVPLTRKYCDKDWYWIVDTGKTAEEDVKTWRNSGMYWLSYTVRSVANKESRVVGGEMPPLNCDQKQK